jgi:putative sigma-54 modulation protein
MLLTITAKHIEMTDAIKEYIESKTAKLPKYYNNINKIEVIVDGNDGGQIGVELIASAEHSKIFIASETGEDMYACIDQVAHKIERQISRRKKKERNNKHHSNGSAQVASETAE